MVLTEGSVFDAVRASIAIPGIFRPWRVNGRALVDGGLVNPVPVSAAAALGAEFVIALNVLPLRSEPTSRSIRQHLELVQAEGADEAADDRLGLVEVVWQSSRILAAQVASHRLRIDRPGFLLQISVPEVGMFDVHRTAELVEVGRRSAEAALQEIRDAWERAVPLRRRLRDWPRRAGALLATS